MKLNPKQKRIITVFCFFGLLITQLPGYAGNSCKDQLWKQYRSELWDGPNRWSGEWTRNGCSNVWTVVWRGPKGELQTYDITMVKNGSTVSFVSPYCRYTGSWSSYSEIISGKHPCGSRGGNFTLTPGPGNIMR